MSVRWIGVETMASDQANKKSVERGVRVDQASASLPGLFLSLQKLSVQSEPTMAPKRPSAGAQGAPKRPRGKAAAAGEMEFVNFRTPDCIGAMQGTMLRGLRREDANNWEASGISDTAYEAVSGVVLEVAQGAIYPLQNARNEARQHWNRDDGSGWARRLGSSVRLSIDLAQQQIDQFEAYALEGDNHLLGFRSRQGAFSNPENIPRDRTHGYGTEAPLRFRIIRAGKWSEWPKIREWQQEGALVDPAELGVELQKVVNSSDHSGFGPLALRIHHWIATPASGIVDAANVAHVDVRVAGSLAPAEPSVYYRLEANNDTFVTVKMPPSAPQALEIEGVPALVDQAIDLILSENAKFQLDGAGPMVSALRSLPSSPSSDAVDQAAEYKRQARLVFDVLKKPGIGFGFLKSCFQKLCRLQANLIRLPNAVEVDGRVVVMVTLGLCFSKKGDGFVPDLGMFVRGQTAALKRLGVTCGEDAFPMTELLRGLQHGAQDPGTIIAALMGAGLCTMRIANYNVPDSVIVSSMLINCMALETPAVVIWRSPVRIQHVAAANQHVMQQCNRENMAMAARLLRVLRAFGGDMDLFDTIVELTVDDQVPCFESNSPPVIKVPLTHAIDQHVYRGIAHASLTGSPTFAARFRDIFSNVTGFSPRLALAQLNRQSLIVKQARHMQLAVAIKVFNLVLPFQFESTSAKTMRLQLDPGVLSGGVGTLGPFNVRTTAEENAADQGPPDATNWSLLVVIGVESSTPIVINSWSVRDNARKPPVTATARAKAIEKARDQVSLRFASPMLPEYNRAVFVDGGWSVTSTTRPALAWSWSDPVTAEFEYVEFTKQTRANDPVTNPNGRILPDLTDDGAMISFLREKTEVRGAIWDRLDAALVEIVQQLGELAESAGFNRRVMHVRFLSMLRQQYEEVAMPTPGLKGELGSDQLKADEGDWLVYRALLWVSRAAPGALTPKQLPNFDVVDSRLLRAVEKKLANLIIQAYDPQWKERFERVCDAFEASFGTPVVGGRRPFDYQRNLVQTMLDRDDAAVVKTPGHFVSLDTGLGKSLIGVWYALSHLRQKGDAGRIIWVTPKNVVQSAFTELSDTWGLGDRVRIVDKKAPSFRGLINLVGFEWFSSGGSRDELELQVLKAASTSFIVFDEVHTMYSTNIRNSTMRAIAQACPKFACMTATPLADKAKVLAIDWLRDTVGFPVNRANQLVASAMMVAARFDLGIDEEDVIKMAQFAPEDAQRHLRALQNGRDWNTASRIARETSYPLIVQTAIDAAAADRAANPNGGVLIFADSNDEAERIRNTITARVGPGKVGERTPETERDGAIEYVVTHKRDCSGYNFIRMGVIISGVYAGNAADRKQARGRIKRVGQTRAKVTYVTVYTQFSILELLHQRHSAVDMANASLEQLAEVFVARAGVGM